MVLYVSSDTFYVVTYYIKWVTTSWTTVYSWANSQRIKIRQILFIGLIIDTYTTSLGHHCYCWSETPHQHQPVGKYVLRGIINQTCAC